MSDFFDSLVHRTARLGHVDPPIRMHFAMSNPTTGPRNTILLIHGFPQTSYQFRHVMEPLTRAGYRVVAPDYRGAGQSSHPDTNYTKATMAADLHELVTAHLQISEPIYVLGHDIGGMVAHAYAFQFPKSVRAVSWGECPLPGTPAFERAGVMPDRFHFLLHKNRDLAVALVQGRERTYLSHFFDKQAVNASAISSSDLDRYVEAYTKPGALRSAFSVYDAFSQDAEDNQRWLEETGKCKVPLLMMNAQLFDHVQDGPVMAHAMYQNYELAEIEGSGHFIAEEEPEQFVDVVLAFIAQH